MADITPLPAGAIPFRPPEALTAGHDVAAFSSRHDALNAWLKRRALANEGKGISRTFVVCLGQCVVSYYSLAAGSVRREALHRGIRHNTPDEIPVVVLGRLATDHNFERRGLGRGMLSDAIRRTLAAANEIGVRALVVHAIDDEAVGFYKRFGFVDSPIGGRTLLLPVETARGALLAE